MGFHKELLPPPATYFEGQGLKLIGRSIWRTTQCVFHRGSDSMRVNMQSGGWVCMNCGVKGGDVLDYHMKTHRLDFVAAARQLGAWIDDATPTEVRRASALPSHAILDSLSFEANLIAIAAGNVARGVRLTEDDQERLFVAAARIGKVARSFRR